MDVKDWIEENGAFESGSYTECVCDICGEEFPEEFINRTVDGLSVCEDCYVEYLDGLIPEYAEEYIENDEQAKKEYYFDWFWNQTLDDDERMKFVKEVYERYYGYPRDEKEKLLDKIDFANESPDTRFYIESKVF